MSLSVDQALRKARRHAKRGEVELAVEEYEKILQKFPKNERAIKELKALQRKPDLAEAHYNQGKVQYSLGNAEAAIVSYQKALQFKPDFAAAHYNLSKMQFILGKTEEAVSSLKKTLQIRPDFVEAHINLGNALNILERPEAALASFGTALQLEPDFADAHAGLGNAHNMLGKSEDAVASYHHALEIEPNDAKTHNNLGNVLRNLGKVEAAEASYDHALQIEPDYIKAHNNLSNIKTYLAGDLQTSQMIELVERDHMPNEDRMLLNFALGKAHDDIGSHENAFTYFLNGNRLRKAELKYEISPVRALFTLIKSTFSNRMPALNIVAESTVPIFVLGMPRSGTTLVEQILASHSEVHGAGELSLLGQSIDASKWNSTLLTTDQLLTIRHSYLQGLQKLGVSSRYITDKLPLNFCWIGFIFAAIPEAKIVHIVRDARATCWSNFRHCFSLKGNGFTNDLQDVTEYYKMYIDLMAFWHERLPGRIFDLHYEALTENQEYQTRKLLEYIGLNWEHQCLEFHKTDREIQTASATQVRRKMYQGSSDDWRKYEKQLESMVESLKGF